MWHCHMIATREEGLCCNKANQQQTGNADVVNKDWTAYGSGYGGSAVLLPSFNSM